MPRLRLDAIARDASLRPDGIGFLPMPSAPDRSHRSGAGRAFDFRGIHLFYSIFEIPALRGTFLESFIFF